MQTELVKVRRGSDREIGMNVRYILSKYSYEGITEEEYRNLWEGTIYLLRKYGRGEVAGLKAIQLSLLADNLRYINPNGRPKGGRKFLTVDPILTKVILSPHAYYGLRGQADSMSRVGFLVKILTKRRYAAQSRIGVGYRDKGTARKPHWDGSPGWQEVAASGKVSEQMSQKHDFWISGPSSARSNAEQFNQLDGKGRKIYLTI